MNPRFCRCCGLPLVSCVPEGDDRPRDGCASCGHIEYRNPRVRAGCIFRAEDGTPVLRTVLLLPGERLQDGALRAAGARAPEDQLQLFCAVSDRARAEISLVFRTPGPLSSHGTTAGEAAPPWAPALLERFAADLAAGVLPVYTAEAEGGRLHLGPVGGH